MQVSTSTRVAAVLIVAKIFNDILPALAQGGPSSSSSSSSFDQFISKRSVRNTWIAFWILWIIWSLISLLHYGTRDNDVNRSADNAERGNETRSKGLSARFGRGGGSGGHGADRAASLARDLLLGLLSALVINTIARGSGVAVEILTWFYLGIALILLLVEILVDSKIVKIFFGIVEFGILLTIFSLSYSRGWYSI